MKKFYRVLAYIKPYWGYAVLNVIFNLLTIVFSLFSMTLLVPFLNLLFSTEALVTVKPELSLNADSLIQLLNYYISKVIIEQGQMQALIYICIILIVAFFLRNLTRFFAMFYMANVRIGSVKDIRNAIYKKILILPLSFYNKHRKGDIISRVTTDVQEVEYSIMNYLEMIVRDPITILAYIAFMFSVSPQLTLFVLVLLPITGLLIGQIGKSLRKSSIIGQARMAGMMSTIEETISGLRIIKAFSAINYSDTRFKDQNNLFSRLMVSIYRRRDLSSPLSEFLSSFVIVIVLWFGGRLVLGDSPVIQAADFIVYIIVFSQIIPPAKTFAQGFYSIQKGIASAERIFEILDAEEVITEKPNAKAIKTFEKNIEYRDVQFSYDKEPVLKGINLNIEKGKLIALVGESGGGKSTMVDLLPRFYDVIDGQILIDGTDIRDYKIDDLRGLMGIVTQESILFNDSVFNNIAFGNTNATMEAVIEAAKVANAHEFIMRLENGYETYIGDRGMNLSGGQRQRLSIARAVLKNPPILILDEATSSLDTESERLVQDALAKVMSSRTSVVIAHRLSTIQHADEIIVIVQGEIAERGSHEELLESKGVYRRLYDLQTFS
ncbi:MAG: ABC transporter ATP-binding protein [Bacteroidales bacterium]|jgi:subfamily B ATP-binding cassette protein MsbA|nr:ABC transporter ATP-binding protein [Bacteroidales bacterium]MDN5349400.1 ATP-binding cassette, subfamily bacterial MsbA [Bacteroidales bacterium]